jgi:hypothetical protein
MTQAYRCDETALENQNDSKFSLEKKRDAFFSRKKPACDSCESFSFAGFHLPMTQRKMSRMTRLAPMSTSIARIERRATHSAWTMSPNEKALSSIRNLLYGDACFDCMTWRKAP